MRPTRLLEPKLHIPMNKLYLAPVPHLTTSPPHHPAPHFIFISIFHIFWFISHASGASNLLPSALSPPAHCSYHITGGHSEHFYRGLRYQRQRLSWTNIQSSSLKVRPRMWKIFFKTPTEVRLCTASYLCNVLTACARRSEKIHIIWVFAILRQITPANLDSWRPNTRPGHTNLIFTIQRVGNGNEYKSEWSQVPAQPGPARPSPPVNISDKIRGLYLIQLWAKWSLYLIIKEIKPILELHFDLFCCSIHYWYTLDNMVPKKRSVYRNYKH